LIVRNDDVPGVIGRVATYLGDAGVNISNMVVGESQVTGEAALMGMDVSAHLTDEQLTDIRGLQGIHEADFLHLA
ncbi:MAG: ACT domain-containing protein, partial [Acidimicrobiia bacterium]|nr:ACT domain-containing protein [Acidimicrobiia bacterium]